MDQLYMLQEIFRVSVRDWKEGKRNQRHLFSYRLFAVRVSGDEADRYRLLFQIEFSQQGESIKRCRQWYCVAVRAKRSEKVEAGSCRKVIT